MASVALTLAYTPILKPIPLVKNFVVALVIAAAIAAGGLAAGAGVAATLTPTVLTFFVIGKGDTGKRPRIPCVAPVAPAKPRRLRDDCYRLFLVCADTVVLLTVCCVIPELKRAFHLQ